MLFKNSNCCVFQVRCYFLAIRGQTRRAVGISSSVNPSLKLRVNRHTKSQLVAVRAPKQFNIGKHRFICRFQRGLIVWSGKFYIKTSPQLAGLWFGWLFIRKWNLNPGLVPTSVSVWFNYKVKFFF